LVIHRIADMHHADSAPRTRTAATSLALLVAFALASLPLRAQAPATTAQPAAPASGVDSPEYKRGRLLYIQCRACHELKAGAPNKVGPNLHGIMGQKAAQVAGFAYSPALRAANLTWDRAMLDRWLERPSAVVPGNAMAFAGVANANDRAALITYIEIEAAAAK
jgi:cytochrome c